MYESHSLRYWRRVIATTVTTAGVLVLGGAPFHANIMLWRR